MPVFARFTYKILLKNRAVLICRQKKGAEGYWIVRSLLDKCPNFYPSRSSNPENDAPRLIPLTRGQFAIVDADDYPSLSKYTWFAEGTPKNYYAVRKHKGKSIKMHRQITKAPDHLVVDHIDHSGLNNRKQDLRPCTFAQNCRNLRSTAKKTSKYKGVYWYKAQKKWAAQITANKKSHHLGYFSNQTAAARAYDKAARKFHGDFASLNFLPTEPRPSFRACAIGTQPVACATCPQGICCTRCFWNIIEKKSKILAFRDRFDILIENNLSGVAMCLIWEILA
jgi:hypothetical protein